MAEIVSETVSVPLGAGRGYTIHIGTGNLAGAGAILRDIARSQRVVIVSQPPIARHYLAPLQMSLTEAGFAAPEVVLFPAGERYKNLRTLEKLYTALYEITPAIDRKTLVVALGGGVVGDVVGYLAASYLRGLDYVQIPTTLLAMVDSSVGGKTGIDFRAGKNLVGAFHQPRAVVVDTETLRTLPTREMAAGLAEVIKYGVIRDAAILERAETGQDWAVRPDPDLLRYLVRRSCEIKAEVVVQDEFETSGLRALLNFGHTIGHAVEGATQYRRYKHGEAVAIGMIAAACIGEAVDTTPLELTQQIAVACRRTNLPISLPEDIADDALIALLERDKKSENGTARFVLARGAGDTVAGVAVEESAIRAGLQKQRAEY